MPRFGDDRSISPSLRENKVLEEVVPEENKNVLERDDYQRRFKQLQTWRRQARVAQAENRTEMAIDEDFYDGIQLDPEDLNILISRSQPPVTFNVIKNAINWVLGTERKSRLDWRVLPRKKSGASEAKTKTKLMKYVNDVNKAEFVRSEAFTESACAGIGWIECGAKNVDEVLFLRTERWRNMWYDHLDTSMDGSMMRYVFREKWVDLDVMIAMFPDRRAELEVFAESINSLYPFSPDDAAVLDGASEFDFEGDLGSLFGPFDGSRERVKVIEMQYRVPENVRVMRTVDSDTPFGVYDGAIYRPDMPDAEYLVKGGYFTLTEALKMTVRHAMWAGKTLLKDDFSPYRHNRFSFTPIYCYRRKRDNMPYSIVRDLRDPQSDLNKRRSRALFLMSANQIVVEKKAVDDYVDFHEEMQRPDGIGVVNEGKMQMWRQIEHHANIGEHAQMAQEDERFIHSISGVTADAEWQTRKEMSGKAINLMQNQGMTAHGVIFDNYFYALQTLGELTLSNIEQFYDEEKEVRITGNQSKDEFVEINKLGPDGEMINSVIANKADFILSKTDFRETIRQSMLDQMLELISNMTKIDGRVSLALLDLAIDLMDDLPSKEEALARIRKINGQHAPEDEMTPEEKRQVQQGEMAAAQEAEVLKELQKAIMRIQVLEGESKVSKDSADTALKKLDGFLKALEAAGIVSAAPQIARAADAIVSDVVGNNSGQ